MAWSWLASAVQPAKGRQWYRGHTSSCEDQSNEITEHQERLPWLFFIVSAPGNCSAVGILVAVDFSKLYVLRLSFNLEEMALLISSPQMVSGR